VLDDVMYKSISVGFAFFTVATILGALWAAEAWGGYWSWDPKETWALIVWLNYAAWLHMRLMSGLRGRGGLVGADRPAGDDLRLPGREHVPVGPAFLRQAVNKAITWCNRRSSQDARWCKVDMSGATRSKSGTLCRSQPC
jgi:hypothetical protein